jgi:hypothetical protein
VAEPLLDEVRLAVGEACSHAVEAHQAVCPDEPVRVALTGGGGRFEVVVTNVAAAGEPASGAGLPGVMAAAPGRNGSPPPVPAANGGATPPPAAGVPALPGFPPARRHELGLAVIAGLADDVQVSRTEAGLAIRMSWPSQPA